MPRMMVPLLPVTVATLAALAALAGCATPAKTGPAIADAPVAAPEPEPGWRGIARPADIAAIAALPARLARARAALTARVLAREEVGGPLLDSAAALPIPQLSPGSYYCRLIRFGHPAAPLRAHDPDFCYVTAEGDALALTKQTGATRLGGYIYGDGDTRQIFIGTSGPRGARYGDAAATDLVGTVERIAPFRWRLLLSRAGKGGVLDLYELVPVPAPVPGAKPAEQPGG